MVNVELFSGSWNMPRKGLCYASPPDLWEHFKNDDDLKRFLQFLAEYSAQQCANDASKNHPYPIVSFGQNLINIDHNFFFSVLAKWAGNMTLFVDFAIRIKESGAEYIGYKNGDRAFAFLTYMAYVFPLFSAHTFRKVGPKKYYYHPTVYRRSGTDCELSVIALRRQKLIESIEDEVLLGQFLEYADDGSMELIAGGSQAVRKHWSKAGKKPRRYA